MGAKSSNGLPPSCYRSAVHVEVWETQRQRDGRGTVGGGMLIGEGRRDGWMDGCRRRRRRRKGGEG